MQKSLLLIECNKYFKKNCHLNITRQEIPTFMGTCLSAKLNDQVNYDGGYTGIKMVFNNKSISNYCYWHHVIILHEIPEELPLIILTNNGIPFHSHFETDVNFLIKETIRIDTPNRPCKSTKEYITCLAQCTDQHIRANISCKLPFINAGHLRNCYTPDEARHSRNITITVYEQMDALCEHCQRPCHKTHYRMIMDVIKYAWRKLTTIKILLSDNFVESIKEVALYNSVMLFGDIGGTMGFFLGMCMLNFVHICASVVVWLTGRQT